MYTYVWRYEYDDKLKSNQLQDLCFQKLLKIELIYVHYFYNKTKVTGTIMMTQCLSSRDPTEKSSISYSYVSMSSSENADVRHSGDLHWASKPALALRPSAKCICDGCASSYKGLHVPQSRVLCTNDEPVLLSTSAIQWYHLGWHPPILPATEVPHWRGVGLRYPLDANGFFRFRSFGAIVS